MVDDMLLMSLVKQYGSVRAVASLLGVDHPVLRAIIKRKPAIQRQAQQRMQRGYKKPKELSLKQQLRWDLCSYCGIHPVETPEERMTIDHVVPTAKGGENNLTNMVGACSRCNGKKSDKDLLSFMLEIKEGGVT